MSEPLKNILIYGGGLALEYAAATLRRALPAGIIITVVEDPDSAKHDPFYGTVMPPVAYDFNRSAGLEEPDLIINSNTSLSYGTHYQSWGPGLNWVQCYNLPLPITENVRFHHYLTRLNAPLEPFLPGAMAGRAGRFAHPPEDPKIILSRAEYGYQFSAGTIAALLKRSTGSDGIRRLEGTVSQVETDEGAISSITLDSGQTLEADLFVDTSGPAGALISALKIHFEECYPVCMIESETPSSLGGGPLRSVEAREFGWVSSTPLRDKIIKTTVCHPDSRDSAAPAHGKTEVKELRLTTGCRDQAWAGNCVAIGLAAAVVEPLSTSAFLLLLRDIERLASLVPPTTKMDIEATEYNRRFQDDREHADLFHMALFQTSNLPDAPYWRAAADRAVPAKLEHKIKQFESRGALVRYDLEPFNEEDWTILHFGMGRRAERHDIFINHIDDALIRKNLMAMQNSITGLVQKMPPHGTYLNKMQNYLEKHHG